MSQMTNTSTENISTSLSTSGGVTASLSRVVERTVSMTIALTNSSEDETTRPMHAGYKDGSSCKGLHGKARKECVAALKPDVNKTLREGTRTALAGLFGQDGPPSWLPFAAWFTGLLLISLVTALMVCLYLRSKRPSRGEYAEIPDETDMVAVAVDNAPAAASSEGNLSRQRFLESRRAAAQKSYGTESATQ
ncbi:hypothetical protein DQ04_00441130 [Trypanosoma grayi]|uniref:hypothetical protein n=1 Tax=Trypanosoma grayi TaxID=71804 RepID=UPI0004F42924|nr:hypothetical protein DQ04_00441130 [Trypanosoma grayi]KEG14488.1 hypothetical protein DQ04_00441130 [Trypanosoma grayi]